MNKQGYILRYYLPVKPYFDEEYTNRRFDELLSFCKYTDTDAVMFFVALDPNFYYMNDSVENARLVRNQMLPYIKKLKDEGISYQLNFQNLLGSNPTGADFRSNYAWRNLVDYTGRESEGCACPLCEVFRAETTERLKIWAETNPDIIWIDDDLRMHNHGTPILAQRDGQARYMDYYCFCDEHIRLFNQKHGYSYDRESLVNDILAEGVSPVRVEYLEFMNETVVDTASWVERTVHSVNPNIKLAQMTSCPDVHAAEGRRWDDFLTALCGELTPITRPHFGPYMEHDPREFIDSYRMLSQSISNVKEVYSGRVEYCPEVENTRFTVWAKSAAATSYQLALSAFTGCRNITLSLYDLDGGAFFDEPLYTEMLKNEKPFLDKLANIPFFDMKGIGVKIPTSGNSGKRYLLKTGEGYGNIGGENRRIEKYLLEIGVPCVYANSNEISNNGVYALDAFTASYLTDDELTRILSCSVLLDGGACEVLISRGYGNLIGVNDMKMKECVANVEVIKLFARKDGTYIRIPARIPFNSWYSIEIVDGVEVLSEFIDPLGNISPAFTYFENSVGGKVVVYPAVNKWGDGFYNHYRAKLFKRILNKLDSNIPIIESGYGAMLTAVKEDENGDRYYFCANLAPDTVKEISIDGVFVAESLSIYQSAVFVKRNGTLEKIGKTMA